MAYNKTCERCGCSLDPGETCDCSNTGYKQQPSAPKKRSPQKKKKKVIITGYGIYRDGVLDSVYDDINKAGFAMLTAQDNQPKYTWEVREKVLWV
ncbi:MAG: hypothetical protein AB9835_05040 [Eubacteriales bacterium]